MVRFFFGAKAQIVVGLVFIVLTTVETVLWWPFTVKTVGILSVEALFFAAYGVVATGIALLGVERVEKHVDPTQTAD